MTAGHHGDGTQTGESQEQQATAAPGAAGADQVPAGESVQDAEPAGPGEAEEGASDLTADLGRAEQAVVDLTTDRKRLQAEYVNYKRRVERDRELVQENARFSVLSAFLPVLDDLDRARRTVSSRAGSRPSPTRWSG